MASVSGERIDVENDFIDFVLQCGSEVVPVEVKAGEDRNATTFKHYVAERNPRFAIRFSRRTLRQDGGFVNIPLCLAERCPDLLEMQEG